MPRFCLLIVVLGGAGALGQESLPASRPADPAALIQLLDSDDFATRERATADLLALGESARDRLVAAENEGSLERKVRIAQILRAIGVRASSRPVRSEPTRVSLDVTDRRLSEVVAMLSANSGYPVRSSASGDPLVTLSVRDVPFFEALDRICGVAGCRHQWDARQRAVLLESTSEQPEPAAYGGPVKVALVMLVNSRQVRFAGTSSGSANLQIRVEVEDRSQALGVAMPIRVKDATDDRGRSLVQGIGAAGQSYPVRFDARRQLLAFLPLGSPEPDAKAIAKLELALPLLLPTGYYEAELANPEEGAQAGHGAFNVVVEEWREADQKVQVRLAITRPQVTTSTPPLMAVFDDVVTFLGRDGAIIPPIVQQPSPGVSGVTYTATVPAGVAAVRVTCLEQFETVAIPIVFENVPLP